jgi:hypothetical protein
MNMLSTENAQQLIEGAAKSSARAIEAQANFFEDLLKRNTKVLSTLAGAQRNSFKELIGARTFSQAFEANLAFEASAREALQEAYEENQEAWEALRESLKSIYQPANETVKVSSGKKAEKKAA